MKLTKQEREFWKSFKKKKGDTLPGCKLNQLNVHTNGCYEHEKAKFEIFWKLREQGFKVITECWHLCDGKWLRRDVVDLSNQEIYEAEVDMKRALRFVGKPINIVPVGWKLTDEKWKELVLNVIK